MVKKLSKLVQDSKKLLTPLLKIIMTIIKLSAETSFTTSSEFENLKSIVDQWDATVGNSEEMQANFKSFQTLVDFKSLQTLKTSLLVLSTSLKSIFSNLMLSTEIEPISELSELSKPIEVCDDQDKLRFNRGKTLF